MSEVSPHALPLVLLTGFLGAGKSRLLNAALQRPEMTGSAILINEFGELGIDQELIDAPAPALQLLADGCICCTAQGRLDQALLALLQQSSTASTPIRRVIIETTGLAAPGPVLAQLQQSAALSDRVQLVAVVTVVDAQHPPLAADALDLAQQQIAAADLLVVSKLDLVDAAAGEAVIAALASLNPDAALLRSNGQAEDADWLGALIERAPRRQAPQWTRFAPMTTAPSVRSATPADLEIQTFSLILDDPLDLRRFSSWLAYLRVLCGPTLLRLKGLVHLAGEPGPLVIHGVQRAFYPPLQLASWPDDDHRTRLVFITRGWGQDVVASTLDKLRAATLPADASSAGDDRPRVPD